MCAIAGNKRHLRAYGSQQNHHLYLNRIHWIWNALGYYTLKRLFICAYQLLLSFENELKIIHNGIWLEAIRTANPKRGSVEETTLVLMESLMDENIRLPWLVADLQEPIRDENDQLLCTVTVEFLASYEILKRNVFLVSKQRPIIIANYANWDPPIFSSTCLHAFTENHSDDKIQCTLGVLPFFNLLLATLLILASNSDFMWIEKDLGGADKPYKIRFYPQLLGHYMNLVEIWLVLTALGVCI